LVGEVEGGGGSEGDHRSRAFLLGLRHRRIRQQLENSFDFCCLHFLHCCDVITRFNCEKEALIVPLMVSLLCFFERSLYGHNEKQQETEISAYTSTTELN
jgi:hypothetical protein